MSILPGQSAATQPDADELTKLREQQLRAKVRDLLNDRDRWQKRAEETEDRLERLQATLRHALTITCDACRKAKLTLSCSTAPPDGKHAEGLYAAAIAMGWRLGQATIGILFTTMGRPQPATTCASDECPECMSRRPPA